MKALLCIDLTPRLLVYLQPLNLQQYENLTGRPKIALEDMLSLLRLVVPGYRDTESL